ncbi:hypothetical protein SAMN04487970_104616 [Paenibacillus tianmuensis]|uniref:Uncharacterized protein n=1 Tax=Paenibacillus tianmuensis TaxID=624147 RepID=A0A1G4T9W8_9BACL|nr:hypothetical protein [Paenibacillus tianmuensis]SCW78220.1 hypothetical protein SAMN04487970_104616 [Paenibacillus tianmuensis]
MFEWIWLLYIVISGTILGIRYRKDRREWWIRFSLAASLPIIGFWVPALWAKRSRASDDATGQFAELNLIVQEDTSLTGSVLRRLETEKEMNVVPLEEALLINDLTTRRKVVIDLLKQDSLQYLEVLRMAVNNEDTETSHYAVSAIVEVKRKLMLTMQELSVKYEENKNDPYLLRSYADVLRGFMRSGFLDERTLTMHIRTYISVLDRLIKLEPASADAYVEKLNAELELNDYTAAEHTAQQYLEQFPLHEEAYLTLMKVYFSVGSSEQLKRTLEALKQSSIRLSNQGITMVRFWSEGA